MISSTSPFGASATSTPGSPGTWSSGPNASLTLTPAPETVPRPEMKLTVEATDEQGPSLLIVPAATSPVISMRSRAARFWTTAASTATTDPPKPVSETQGSAAGGGVPGGGGGGGVPAWPGPFANATAPLCAGPVSESTPERLHELIAIAETSAAAVSSTGRRDLGEMV